MAKVYNVKDNHTGKSMKINWEKDEPPTEDEINQIQERENDRTKPVSDPLYSGKSADEIVPKYDPKNDPSLQVNDPMSNNQIAPESDDPNNSQDQTVEGTDQNDVDDSQDVDPFTLYHNSMIQLTQDPQDTDSLLHALYGAKMSNTDPNEVISHLQNILDPDKLAMITALLSPSPDTEDTPEGHDYTMPQNSQV